MRLPTHHDYLAYLQPLARSAIKSLPGELSSTFWARVCQQAGIDLFAKASDEDLTWHELLCVHAYIVEQLEEIMNRWEKTIRSMQEEKIHV